MPTTIASLNNYNPVRNSIRVSVQGDYFITVGTVGTARITFDVADMPADGDTLTIAVAQLGIEEVFTFRTTPSAVNDVAAYAGQGVNTWVSGVLVPAVAANYLIGSLFDATQSPLTMRLAPRQGTAHAAAITVNGFVPLSIDYFPANVEAATQEEYSALVQVWSESSAASGTYLLRSDEEYQPDATGVTRVDVEAVLRSYLRPAVPTLAGGNTIDTTMTHGRFYLRAGERYGTPPQVRPMVQSQAVWAYLAGRSEERRIALPNWDNEIFGSPTDIKFFTIWPNTTERYGKWVAPGQPEFLSWIYPDNRGTVFNLRADLYYETGSPITGHLVQAFNSQDFRHIIVHAGFTKLGLENVDPARRLLRYRLYLTNSGTSLRSEYRHYRIDRRHREHRRYLVYWTSLGGIDVLPLHGQRATAGVVSLLTSDTVDVTALRRVAQWSETFDREVEQGTMHLSEYELPALLDLQGSEDVREWDGTTWRPVQLIGMAEIPLATEAAGLSARAIQYRYATIERAAGR